MEPSYGLGFLEVCAGKHRLASAAQEWEIQSMAMDVAGFVLEGGLSDCCA